MVRADVLEEQWATILSAIRFPDDWTERFQELVPGAGQLQAGIDLGTLWAAATPEERRALTQMLLQALYVDVVHDQITAIEPRPDAKALFTGSDLNLGVTVR
jgi:hypothetical protein